jgi:hypothetical protein
LLDDGVLQSREETFERFELSFTIIFTIEILWNLFGHGIVVFMKDGWSVFDAIVVLISVTSLFLHGSNVKSLRLLRVSRLLKFVTNRVCISVSMCLSGQSILLCSSAVHANDPCTRLLLHSAHLPLSISHVLSQFHPLICLVFASVYPRILTPSLLPHACTHHVQVLRGVRLVARFNSLRSPVTKSKQLCKLFNLPHAWAYPWISTQT